MENVRDITPEIKLGENYISISGQGLYKFICESKVEYFWERLKGLVRSIEKVFDGEWKEGEIWNGEEYDKDGNVINTFVDGKKK